MASTEKMAATNRLLKWVLYMAITISLTNVRVTVAQVDNVCAVYGWKSSRMDYVYS